VLPIFITNPISILSSVVKVRAAEILQILYDYFNGSFQVLLGYPVSAQMHPIKPPKILARDFLRAVCPSYSTNNAKALEVQRAQGMSD